MDLKRHVGGPAACAFFCVCATLAYFIYFKAAQSTAQVSTNGHQFTEGSEGLFTYIDDPADEDLSGIACPVTDGSLCDTAVRHKELEALIIRNRTGM